MRYSTYISGAGLLATTAISPHSLPEPLQYGTLIGATIYFVVEGSRLGYDAIKAIIESFKEKPPELKDIPFMHRSDAHGGARLANPQTDRINLGQSTTGVFFGRSKAAEYTYTDYPDLKNARRQVIGGQLGPYVWSTPNAHTLVCAPTRSGKGVGILVPTLLMNRNSVLAIDPKGELAAITARQRQRLGQEVFLLNPWRLHEALFQSYGFTQFHSFNPLDILDPKDPAIVSNAMFLASLLVSRSSSSDPFWDQSAETLLAGLMLYVSEKEPQEKKLPRVRAILGKPHELDNVLTSMAAASDVFGGSLSEIGHTFLSMPDKTKSSVISTAQAHVKFMLDPVASGALDKSTFSFSSLKQKPATVFLIIPPEFLHSHARWLRLMVGSAIKAFLDPAPVNTRCLFILEEFASLGHMQAILDGVSNLAGYGIDFLFVLQDLPQLKNIYGQAADTFLAESGFHFFTNIRDMTTAKYVSSALGQETITVDSSSASGGTSSSLTGKPLFSPDELLRQGPGWALLFQPGTFPISIVPHLYYKDGNFAALADPNPFRSQT